MKPDSFRTVGNSGLVVSPLALGTMTFGAQRWGSSDDVSRAILNDYVEAGGNFIDSADVYAGGRNEELIGSFIVDRQLRDQLVLATKFTFNAQAGNPNAGGNGRKNIHRALEGSLRRLKTDYIDLYWMHAWDMVTPAEEVLQTLGDLVRAGTIRYFGLSNLPAWYVAKMSTLAMAHGVPGPVALQLEYSLVERGLEREFAFAAREFGLGMIPWSPLAAGFLAGKYQRTQTGATGQGRLSGPNPFGNQKFTDRNWQILETLKTVAAALDRPMAQVALAWAAAQPGVTAPIIGASNLEQLHGNLAALEVRLSKDHLETLNQSSTLEMIFPYLIQTASVNRGIFGGAGVKGWH